MKFDENPFRVLNVSIYDTKATISEQADDLSFADPDSEKIFDVAKNILLNPRKRISAEMRWFVGCSREEEAHVISDLLKNEPDNDDDNDFDFPPLTNLNYYVYCLEDEAIEFEEWDISIIDGDYSALNAEEIRKQINFARAKSGFPAVQDTKAIKEELKNLRDEIREKIQSRFKILSHNERISFANELADYLEYVDYIGVVVEDFFDGYRLEMNAFLDETTEKINSLLTKIKSDADKRHLDELTAKIKAFVNVMKPLDKFSIAQGRNSFDESEKIFYEVRDVAIKLFNEKDLIDYPLKITHILEENFSYLPKLADLIRKDVKFLEEAKISRPTQTFINAQASLKAILTAIDKELHFDKDFTHAHKNINFYLNVFKKRHEVTLMEVMSNTTYKPDERQTLNSMASSIYILVGNSMTWTLGTDWGLPLSLNSRIKLTYELFQKALVYAKAADDAELITLAGKRVDEWKKFAEQVENKIKARETNENSDASDGVGCLILFILFVIYLLSR